MQRVKEEEEIEKIFQIQREKKALTTEPLSVMRSMRSAMITAGKTAESPLAITVNSAHQVSTMKIAVANTSQGATSSRGANTTEVTPTMRLRSLGQILTPILLVNSCHGWGHFKLSACKKEKRKEKKERKERKRKRKVENVRSNEDQWKMKDEER